MQVSNYFEIDNKEHWINEIERSDWRAGAFLGRLLRNGEFFDAVGKDSKVHGACGNVLEYRALYRRI